MNYIKIISVCTMSLFSFSNLFAQKQVAFVQNEKEQKIDVMIDGKFFTAYIYGNKIDKPVLFPLVTASGTTVIASWVLNCYRLYFSEAGSPLKGWAPVAGKSSLCGVKILAIASLTYSTISVSFFTRPFIPITLKGILENLDLRVKLGIFPNLCIS